MAVKVLDINGLTRLWGAIKQLFDTKQDKIDDLSVIRLGAQMGATALREHQDISFKADKSTTLEGYGIIDAYTKDEIESKISSVLTFKGNVDSVVDLPSGAKTGDVYEVMDECINYSWNGDEWVALGALVDLSTKADKGTTLQEYGITDAYNKDEINSFLLDASPIIENFKSYIIKDSNTFNSYNEITSTLYLMEEGAHGYHSISQLGGSGVFIRNDTEDDLSVTVVVRSYDPTEKAGYTFGNANGEAAPGEIKWKLSGSGAVDQGTGNVTGENTTTIPLIIPPGKKGYVYCNGWSDDGSDGPLEFTECYVNKILTVNEGFQAMKIKPEALLPNPMFVTQEEFDAIDPKSPTTLYYILDV